MTQNAATAPVRPKYLDDPAVLAAVLSHSVWMAGKEQDASQVPRYVPYHVPPDPIRCRDMPRVRLVSEDLYECPTCRRRFPTSTAFLREVLAAVAAEASQSRPSTGEAGQISEERVLDHLLQAVRLPDGRCSSLARAAFVARAPADQQHRLPALPAADGAVGP